MKLHSINWKQIAFVGGGGIGLVLVYVFQDYLNLYNGLFGDGSWKIPYVGTDYLDHMSKAEFIVNKIFRYLLNDFFSILIIHGIFLKKSYTRFAILLMAFGLLILLPLYFYFYLASVPGFSSMISHMHRLVLNPVIMMLLIPALWYQSQVQGKNHDD